MWASRVNFITIAIINKTITPQMLLSSHTSPWQSSHLKPLGQLRLHLTLLSHDHKVGAHVMWGDVGDEHAMALKCEEVWGQEGVLVGTNRSCGTN